MHIVPMTKQELAQFIADRKDQFFGGTTETAGKIIDVVDDEETAQAIEEAIRAVERDAGLIEEEEIKEELVLSEEESSMIFDNAMKTMEVESAEIAAEELVKEARQAEIEKAKVFEKELEKEFEAALMDFEPEIEEDIEDPQLKFELEVPEKYDYSPQELDLVVEEEFEEMPQEFESETEEEIDFVEEEYSGSFEDALKDDFESDEVEEIEDLEVIELKDEEEIENNDFGTSTTDLDHLEKEERSSESAPTPSSANHYHRASGQAKWLAPMQPLKAHVQNETGSTITAAETKTQPSKTHIQNNARWLAPTQPPRTHAQTEARWLTPTQPSRTHAQTETGFVPSEPVVPPMQNTAVKPQKKKHTGIKIALGLIIAFALLAGGGFAAYTFLSNGKDNTNKESVIENISDEDMPEEKQTPPEANDNLEQEAKTSNNPHATENGNKLFI